MPRRRACTSASDPPTTEAEAGRPWPPRRQRGSLSRDRPGTRFRTGGGSVVGASEHFSLVASKQKTERRGSPYGELTVDPVVALRIGKLPFFSGERYPSVHPRSRPGARLGWRSSSAWRGPARKHRGGGRLHGAPHRGLDHGEVAISPAFSSQLGRLRPAAPCRQRRHHRSEAARGSQQLRPIVQGALLLRCTVVAFGDQRKP